MGDVTQDDLQRLRDCFSAIYDRNEWGVQSGVGALPANNVEYSAFLQNFIHYNKVRSPQTGGFRLRAAAGRFWMRAGDHV